MSKEPLTRSGWCMKYPVTQWNTEEHDKCPMHFPHRSCTCDCGHKGERTLESRGMTYQPYIPPKALKIEKEDSEET